MPTQRLWARLRCDACDITGSTSAGVTMPDSPELSANDAARHARDQHFMQFALALARRAERAGEVPVGSLVTRDDEVLGEGWNRPVGSHDPTAHAEIVAMRAAATKIANYRMPGTTLYVTLEPCAMCAGAIVQARIARVVFGAHDPRAGAAGSVLNLLCHPVLNHRAALTAGVEAEACAMLLVDFFKARRGAARKP